MICHKCNEDIGTGEANIPHPIIGSGRYWYFHPGCFAEWNEEQRKEMMRVNNVRHLNDMAGQLH